MQRGQTKYLFSYDASGNVVSVKHGDDEYYYLRNAQGDIVKLIDASGVSVVEYTYDTWGKAVTTTGTLAGTLGLFQPFRYRGYVYDWETGFYYLQSRYYDPATGRFISADRQFDKNAGVCGYNLYAYCANNPIAFYDSEGESITLICILVGAGIGLLVGAYVGDRVATSNGYDPYDGWNYWRYVVGFGCIGTAAGALIGWGAGAIISALGPAAAASSIPAGGGVAYESFQQLKNSMGSAGAGMQWHHIVEQCQIKRSGFPVSWIQNSNNVIRITTEIHRKVSAYYSQIQTFTNGMTFRNWVTQFSFEEQYEWGLYVLRLFGVIE